MGFHCFKCQDNDPSNLKTDPSNRDANKGIVTLGCSLYSDLNWFFLMGEIDSEIQLKRAE